MKLIIQIPCYNEEKTLPLTLANLPREIEGISEIEVLVIDDGSTDRTVDVAKKCGVRHIVRFPHNMGLARAFKTGIDKALELGADIIVNTDGDNQYNGNDIPKLIMPILKGNSKIVIGARQIDTIDHFSPIKKRLQKIGSSVVRRFSGTDIPDTTSGFRAFSREAALRLNVVSTFSYTLETIIEAGKRNIAITHVPIQTNEKTRESRLASSISSYIMNSAITILRIYTLYEPLRVFFFIGATLFGLGALLLLRYVYFLIIWKGGEHIPSLVISAILVILGFQVIIIGLISDIMAANRRLLEDILYSIRKKNI